jgi:hypothetical protein
MLLDVYIRVCCIFIDILRKFSASIELHNPEYESTTALNVG